MLPWCGGGGGGADAGGVQLHWRVFGSAPHVERPDGCTLANYIYSIPAEVIEQDLRFRKNPAGHMKAIVNTKFWAIGCNPHACTSTRPYALADGRTATNMAADKLQYDRAYVHHYVTRCAGVGGVGVRGGDWTRLRGVCPLVLPRKVVCACQSPYIVQALISRRICLPQCPGVKYCVNTCK
jgi:hypothetical protein